MRAEIAPDVQAEIVRDLESGETYASIGARHMLNPVTVGAIGKAHGFKSPRGQASAAARTGSVLRQTESEFQRTVIHAATVLGWTVFHPWISKHSTAGFPDLVLCRPPRPVIYAELKSETGKTTPAQDEWAALLLACEGVEYHLWRPSMWDEIKLVLSYAPGSLI